MLLAETIFSIRQYVFKYLQPKTYPNEKRQLFLSNINNFNNLYNC